MKPVVFIHGKKDQALVAKVAEYSLKRNSKHADRFETRIILLEDFPFLSEREGQRYKKEKKIVRWTSRDPQSFVLLRFLPPQLMGYEGRAVVIDPDIFAVGDVDELLSRDMKGKAIYARLARSRRTASKGDRNSYMTSVMLLDCAKLKHWRWEDQIREMFELKRSYTRWMCLGYELPDSIGPLEEEWNHLDTLNEKTKLLHNTRRFHQPWLTGLPYHRTSTFDHNTAKVWNLIPKHWMDGIRTLLRGEGYLPYGRHEKHPDCGQERLFLMLLRECLKAGLVTEENLQTEIQKKNIRPDMLDQLETLSR